MQERAKFLPSFGRKRARGLSQTQQENLITLYEKYGIEPQEPILLSGKKLFFEIGFGNGEHLIKNAILHPDVDFIGCEPFENGVAATLKAIEDNNLKNVRIYKGDARLLLERMPDFSIDRFYALFPDPWRKKKHHKRRILSEEFLKFLMEHHRGGELVIATDSEDYMTDVALSLNRLGLCACEDILTLSQRPDWFLGTKYEKKALERGAKCYYLMLPLFPSDRTT